MTAWSEILVALPAYNEAKYIATIIREAQEHADEVLVLDDGSTDGTALIAEAAGAVVVRHSKNKGYGSTIQSILVESRSRNPDVLVVIDADSQHFPSDIPAMIAPTLTGYDLVIGRRNSKDIPLFRRIGGRALGIATRLLSGADVVDTQCGFRAYSRKAVRMIRPKETGMAVSSEIVILASMNRLRITEVPISVRYTDDSSTHNPWKQGFYTLWRVILMVVK